MAQKGEDPRMQLRNLQEKFSGFERQMEMETKARMENEETVTNDLTDTVARLEKTLNAEIKRRVEANKALQGMFEAQMATVQDKLEAGLMDRLESLNVAVTTLNDRVDSVDKDFSQAREQYIIDIEDKSSMVAKDAANLQASFQNERADRKEREMLVVAKLRALDSKTSDRLETDKETTELKYRELKEELQLASRDDGDKRFQDYILEEMAALKNGLVVESQMRERADDDIVSALNHYTNAIQDALRVVNSA